MKKYSSGARVSDCERGVWDAFYFTPLRRHPAVTDVCKASPRMALDSLNTMCGTVRACQSGQVTIGPNPSVFFE